MRHDYHRLYRGLTIAIAWLAFAVFATQAVRADESVYASFSLTDDGSCERELPTFELGYDRNTDELDVRGDIRLAPAGGDCRDDSLSYNVEAERRFDFGFGFDGLVKFQASENSLAAPYAIVDDMGNVLTRADGGASDPVLLPAGRARTVLGILGASRTFDISSNSSVDLAVGRNFSPVGFADGSESQTVHVALSASIADVLGGDIGANVSFDRGDDGGQFGQADVAWTRDIDDSGWALRVAYSTNWSLNELASDAPAMATFSGLPAVNLGAPADRASYFSLGFSRAL